MRSRTRRANVSRRIDFWIETRCPHEIHDIPATGDIREAVKQAVGIDCRIVLISRRHGLPVTSSGKLSRTRARANFIAGAYAATVASPVMAAAS